MECPEKNPTVKNPAFKKKPTNTERRRRLDIVESLLIDGASVPELLRYFSEKESLRLGRRTVERYVKIAEKKIQRAAGSTRELEIQKAKRRFERCFARAITGNKKNLPAAIAAQKGLNALLGLNAPNDTEEELSVEAFARQVVLERQEMERTSRGPAGLQNEILELFQRLQSSGEDCTLLIKQILNTHLQNDRHDSSTTE